VRKLFPVKTVKAVRKDVTAKCYGGDITRKKKTPRENKEREEKDEAGRKCEVPQQAFLAVLKLD